MQPEAPIDPIVAAIYVRQSLDRTGEGLGVERQRQDCQQLADSRGWKVSKVISENSVSASKGERDGFKRLIELMKSGTINVVVCWHIDRLTRKITDLERIIEVSEQTNVKIATVSGDIDLSTDMGRTIGRILAAVARGEVERKSARQKRANRQKAQAGKPHGARRAFGYEPDGVTVREEEALVLKDMAHRFVNGWSYKELAYWLNESGIKTAQGKLFYPVTIRNMLGRKRYAGIREYEGAEYEAIWQPIFDADMWAHLQYTIKTRKDRAGNRPVARRYPLTGLVSCASCGQPLNGETKRDHPSRPLRRTYQCRVQGNTRREAGCGGVTINADALEHFVRELLAYRYDTPDLATLLKGEQGVSLQPLLDRQVATSARLNALVDDYADGTLDKAQFARAKQRAEKTLEELEQEITAVHQSETAKGLLEAGMDVREAWNDQTPGWKNKFTGLLIERIVIKPSKKKPFYDCDGVTMRFDPERVEIAWKA